MKKKLIALLLIMAAPMLFQSCTEVPVMGASPVTQTGQDLNSLAAQATQTYIDYKSGNINYAWLVEHGLWAYQTFIKTRDDLKRVVSIIGGPKTLGDKLAEAFGASNAPPEVKVAALAKGVNTAAVKTTKG